MKLGCLPPFDTIPRVNKILLKCQSAKCHRDQKTGRPKINVCVESFKFCQSKWDQIVGLAKLFTAVINFSS
jgi:hypothetical protein